VIPDPGRASKAVEIVIRGSSAPVGTDGGYRVRTVPAASAPFDSIRIVTLEGREYWSARDLMPLLGYEKWENFAEAISRAKVSAYNSGHDVAQNFPGAGKVSGTRGPAQADYHLSRLACYLIAMNGDPRKDEVAAAQAYFAIRTREAEVAQPATSTLAIPQTYAEALRAAADQAERAELAESKVRELAGPASSWNELAEAAGDYSVADAAKVLSRSDGIDTGERRLFKQMQGLGWIYRRDGHWSAYQAQLDTGRLVEKVGQRYWKPIADQWIAPTPTIRITPKGLQELHKRLGGGGEQLALASVE
jgi:phage antirepressor YoqD-like protein